MTGDDLLYLDLTGEANLFRNLDQMPDVVREICLDKVTRWTRKMEADVADNIKSRLKEKSGKLLEGLDSEVIEDGRTIRGRVFIAGVPYAKPQEEGATVGPHMIYPHKARVLAFYGYEGKKIFATRVSHPGGHIPGHHFMKDAYRENGPQLRQDLKKGIIAGIRAHMRRSA